MKETRAVREALEKARKDGLVDEGASCPPLLFQEWTEAKFQERVIVEAHSTGWLVAHFRPSRTKKGWRTAVSADGKGFCDLLMIRGRRMVVAELKIPPNKPTEEQKRWLLAFRGVVEAYLWTPADWQQIERILA